MSVSILSRMALNDEGFMFDPQTGESFLVNETARALLDGLKEGLGEGELQQRLVTEWSVDADQAARDVAEFLQQLRLLGLVS